MRGGAAGGLSRPGGRRDRLRRERTAGQLRRQARLEAEAQEQLGPTLGPAGRPMGEAAMAGTARPLGDGRYAVAVRGGGEATVRLLPVGFDSTGPRARVVGAAPCPT